MAAPTVPDLREASRLRTALVGDLERRGVLDHGWRDAFLAVARHAFLPEVVFDHDRSAGELDLLPVRRTADPDGWLRRAYADDAVITQVDGVEGTVAGREATSSASMPSVVARMLLAADVRPGHRVLEIGTGTGYHAALLAHRIGAAAVTTVEIDTDIADRARSALRTAGYGDVEVLTADGARPLSADRTFDRVIATAAVTDVPYSWVTQTRLGGRVVTPWTSTYHPSGLLVLDRGPDEAATGRIGDPVDFMALRALHVPRFRPDEIAAGPVGVTETDLHASELFGRDVETAIGLRVPRCRPAYVAEDEERGTFWLIDQWTGSWSTVQVQPRPPFQVRQHGSRRLFDEVSAARRWWIDAGSPTVQDWTFTVDADGTRARPAP